MKLSYSLLAKRAQNMRSLSDAIYRVIYGVAIHTTGSGVVDHSLYETVVVGKRKIRRRRKEPLNPLAVAVDIYRASQNGANGYKWGGPTYVIPHDGTPYQLCPEEVFTNHCGGPNRRFYRSGSWINKVSPITVAKCNAQWGPRFNDPYDLFPSTTPNRDYVGVELIPCGAGVGDPRTKGERFTKLQYESLIELLRDVGSRHQFPAGWWRGPRLVGHEDVDPIQRHDKGGGWDPGFLRGQPYFDFDYVRSSIA
jgi:hypothetical protein